MLMFFFRYRFVSRCWRFVFLASLAVETLWSTHCVDRSVVAALKTMRFFLILHTRDTMLGGRVKGAALKTLGVATHCIPSSSLNDLYDALSKLPKYIEYPNTFDFCRQTKYSIYVCRFCSDFQVSNTIEKFETVE
jgi:hypothetical protein